MRRLASLLFASLLASSTAGAVSLPQAGQLAGAPQRATAQELKATQASVDAALKLRRARFDAWQKALKARDAQAAAVQKLKKQKAAGLEDALRKALALDEEAARARSAVLAAEADLAKGGAQLLRLYDQVLIDRRGAVEALPARSAARAAAVASFRDLTAQRDAVRQALLPVLGDEAKASAAAADLEIRASDDVESLLEKADLARDLEERFLRQAENVRRRIKELEDEQAVAKDVIGMVGRSQLFDEEDRRLFVVRTDVPTAAASTTKTTTAAPAPSAGRGDAPEADLDTVGECVGCGAPPPPNGFDGAPQAPAVVSSPSASVSAPVTVRSEQAIAAPTTDTGIASLLSSSTVSVDALRAIEKKLKDDANRARERSKKLKAEAQQRARD